MWFGLVQMIRLIVVVEHLYSLASSEAGVCMARERIRLASNWVMITRDPGCVPRDTGGMVRTRLTWDSRRMRLMYWGFKPYREARP